MARGRSRGNRKYMNIATITSSGTAVYLPAGARVLYAKGANAEADTWTLQVNLLTRAAGSTTTTSFTYAGIPNGRALSLQKDWPNVPNIQTAPLNNYDTAMTFVPGTTSQVEVYYAIGSSILDNPSSFTRAPSPTPKKGLRAHLAPDCGNDACGGCRSGCDRA